MEKVMVVSVTDKTTIIHDVGAIKEAIEASGDQLLIYSTGGTARKLRDEGGFIIHDIAELTGGEELFGDLVKTLSREVAAGLLARSEHLDELIERGMKWIDIVIVDFYDLGKAIREAGGDPEKLSTVIKGTDIGGPTMAREAAKGRRLIICRPQDRQKLINHLKTGEKASEELLSDLAATAEWEVAKYAAASASYHGKGRYFTLFGEKVAECKYGENAHQAPAYLFKLDDYPLALHKFELVAGDASSFNNYNDLARLILGITRAAAAYDVFYHGRFMPKIAMAVKHGNFCGAGIGEDRILTTRAMIEGDNRAIFGGVVILNFPVDELVAETLLSYKLRKGEKRRNLDCIAAPAISMEAIEMLRRKKDKCRFLINPTLANLTKDHLDLTPEFRQVPGGVLVQPASSFILDIDDPEMEVVIAPSARRRFDLILAWAVGSSNCSNTVTIVKDSKLLGNGVAQQDRVTACRLAIMRAKAMKHDLENAVAYSDSFFIADDGPRVLHRAGISVIFASSGSQLGDKAVAEYCAKVGISLLRLPDKKCRGFRH